MRCWSQHCPWAEEAHLYESLHRPCAQYNVIPCSFPRNTYLQDITEHRSDPYTEPPFKLVCSCSTLKAPAFSHVAMDSLLSCMCCIRTVWDTVVCFIPHKIYIQLRHIVSWVAYDHLYISQPSQPSIAIFLYVTNVQWFGLHMTIEHVCCAFSVISLPLLHSPYRLIRRA